MVSISMQRCREIAYTAATSLDSQHGDPAKQANWLRERQLALIVLALLERLAGLEADIEVPR